MIKICTPEDVMGIDRPWFSIHHGTCDHCKKQFTIVFHFGYDTQPERDYRVCESCFDSIKPRLVKEEDDADKVTR